MAGFKKAAREACDYITKNLAVDIDENNRDILINIAKTSMSSKIIGNDAKFFSELVVDALLAVKTKNLLGESKFPIKAVNIIKSHG
jgi:T-complex protein 1 subunit alpha